MSRATALLRLGLAGVLALTLGGCISLLPKAKPVQLYRFSAAVPATSGEDGSTPVHMRWSIGAFQRETAGDRILTITGERAAYIAEARWVAPAQVLFEQAAREAFDASSGRVRLVARGTPNTSDYALRLNVRNFETRYEAGRKAAPTVVVAVHATVSHGRTRALVAEHVFSADAQASDNRVSAIVRAYDDALSEVLGQVVSWTDEVAK